jgi:hypothetical protein
MKANRRGAFRTILGAVAWLVGGSAAVAATRARSTPDDRDRPVEEVVGEPGRRYSVLVGGSIFWLNGNAREIPLVDPRGTVIFEAEDGRKRPEHVLVYDHTKFSGHYPRDRRIGVGVEHSVGTYDELVADYAYKLKRAIGELENSDKKMACGQGAAHDATLAKAGITSFCELPPAPPERIAYRDWVKAEWKLTGRDPRLPAEVDSLSS